MASTLNDAFDGYNTLCLSLNNTVATCETGNANFAIYNKNGPATSECTGMASGVNRQVVFPNQTSGSITMSRKVFVPDNDSFARWMNYFTNTGATAQTVTMVIANNLGSDSNTIITNSSTGSTTSPFNDTSAKWVATFRTTAEPHHPILVRPPYCKEARIRRWPESISRMATTIRIGATRSPAAGPDEHHRQLRRVGCLPRLPSPRKRAVSQRCRANAVQCMSTQERAEVLNFAAAVHPCRRPDSVIWHRDCSLPC